MTPSEALRRVKLGCSVLCLGVPPGTTFGVDAMLYTVAGAEQTGVKMLPAGLHLLVHSVGHGFHAGQFVDLAPSSVMVRTWDPALEDFRADGYAGSGISEEEHARYAAGVRRFDFDRKLGAYSDENARAWVRLASCIDSAVLAQCGIASGAWIEPAAADVGSSAAAAASSVPPVDDAAAAFGVRRAAAAAGRRCAELRFTPLTLNPTERAACIAGSGALALTRFHVDGSARLRWLLRHRFGGDWRRVVGELQLAFVLFMYLHSLPAFEQWKELVALLCSCDDAFANPSALCAGVQPGLLVVSVARAADGAPEAERSGSAGACADASGGGAELLRGAVTALKRQLELVPRDFLAADDPLARGNFLGDALGALFELTLWAEGGDAVRIANPGLHRAADKLRGFAERRFGVRFAMDLDGVGRLVPAALASGEGAGGVGGDADGDFNMYSDAPRPPLSMEVEELPAEAPPIGGAITAELRADIETTLDLDRAHLDVALGAGAAPASAPDAAPAGRMAWMLPPTEALAGFAK